jgi:hypothetical protein
MKNRSKRSKGALGEELQAVLLFLNIELDILPAAWLGAVKGHHGLDLAFPSTEGKMNKLKTYWVVFALPMAPAVYMGGLKANIIIGPS